MSGTVTTINRRVRRLGRTVLRHNSRRLWFKLAWLAVDAVVMIAAAQAAFLLLGSKPSAISVAIVTIAIGVRLVAFVRLGMYRSVLRYSGIHTVVTTFLGVVLGTSVAVAVAFFLGLQGTAELGRAFLVLEALLVLVICGGARLAVRMAMEHMGASEGKRVLIYGAGDLGEMVMRDLLRVRGYSPVGFIDDDATKHRMIIHGRHVLGARSDLDRLVETQRIQVVVLAISRCSPEFIRVLFQACMARKVHLIVANSITSPQRGGRGGLDLRELVLEDLLPRPSRNLDPTQVKRMLADRCVLVTGAGGSIGSELCRQIALCGVSRLVLLDHGEYNLYAIQTELNDRYPGLPVVSVLCNLQCRQTLDQVLSRQLPQVVFHAAAYKHVPLVEENPFLGTLNNLGSFRTLVAACDDAGVERLVQISTDKAVRPTNVMGATKRACELVLQNYPTRSLHMCAVRFGNVLGSSGSVVPRFVAQIAKGGPVTVTHPDITRYFMLIPEAAALVLQAGALADHGEIFILDMGEPVRISDLARQLVFMSGHDPDQDIRIEYSGLRPGEKLYEELLLDDRESSTSVAGILRAKSTRVAWPELAGRLDAVLDSCRRRDIVGFSIALKEVVPEWQPSAAYRDAVESGGGEISARPVAAAPV